MVATSPGHRDLWIVDGDLAFDGSGEQAIEQTLEGRASIAQDIQHLILESGLLLAIIGERHPDAVQLALTRLEQRLEDDPRLRPGSVRVTRLDHRHFLLKANSRDYGPIHREIRV